MLGFEHIYMYNNKSSDRYNDILNPYIVENKVTLIDWPYDQSQILAYQNYYEIYRNEAQWVSFLDIDEFFCPKYKNSIGEWLKEYERYPVVLIYWWDLKPKFPYKEINHRSMMSGRIILYDILWY